MKENPPQLMLDYPVWRLSWSAYGELKGYDMSEPKCICDAGFGMNLSCPVHSDLSRIEATTDWYDHRPKEKFDYQPAPDEERDAWINESTSFPGEEE